MTSAVAPGATPPCVIVLNWNGRDDTLACLASLVAQTVPVHVLVVDNGSTDDSVAAVRREHPGVEVIETGANLGYAGGNDVGLRHALAGPFRQVLVLNNDTLLELDCVERLAAALDACPGAAAVAPKSLAPGRPDRIHFAGGRVSRDGHAWHVGLGEPDGPAFDVSGDTEWISGCAIFASREALLRVGLFDERFFLLFEDLDWSLRARRLGYRLCYEPRARMRHAGSKSFGGKRGARYQYFFTRNGLLWLERSAPVHRLPLLLPRWIGEARARISRFGRSPGDRRALSIATRWGVEDWLRRRFGPGRGLLVPEVTRVDEGGTGPAAGSRA